MRANIIHNSARDERLPRLLRELAVQGIDNYKLWDAIFLIPKCAGISRAHKQIIQYAKDVGLSQVLVFEDDIKFEAPGAFDYFLDNKPESFDIYLGGIYRGEIIDVPGNIDIDHALNGLGDYHVCYPFAAIQYEGYSDNNREFSHHESLLIGRKIFGRSE
jgi:hypothetical protein